MLKTVNYTLTRGLPFDRLIIVKNKFNHRLLTPTAANAYIQTGTYSKVEMTTTITNENGILMSLTAEETQDLPLGTFSYDVFATIAGIQRPVSQGTIKVEALNRITPSEDNVAMEIRYKQRTDYRRNFTWKDDTGAVITLQSAYMQAVNSAGTTVLDLRWYATKPSENTIAALPAAQRGYLAPYAGSTLEIHISDKNNVPVGEHRFDLLVQDSAGDWDRLATGVLVVEETIATPPA